MQRVLLLIACSVIALSACRNRAGSALMTEANAATFSKMSETRLATICSGEFEGNKADFMLFIPDDLAINRMETGKKKSGKGLVIMAFSPAVEGKGFGDVNVEAAREDAAAKYVFSGESNGVKLKIDVLLGVGSRKDYVGTYQAQAGKDAVNINLACRT